MNKLLNVLRLRNKVVNRNLEVETKLKKNECTIETVCKLSNADNVSINISSSVNFSENVSKVIVNYSDSDSVENIFTKNQPEVNNESATSRNEYEEGLDENDCESEYEEGLDGNDYVSVFKIFTALILPIEIFYLIN